MTAKHPADRHYSPIEAAYAVSQYLDLDPAFFLEQTGLNGMVLATDGKEIVHLDLEGARDETTEFLWVWMKVSGAGKAIRALLLKRHLLVTF